MTFLEGGSQSVQAQGELSATLPLSPFEDGRIFGLDAFPISAETATLFRTGFGRKAQLDVELSRAYVRMQQALPDTVNQHQGSAIGWIDGHVDGLRGRIFKYRFLDGEPLIPIERRAMLDPNLLQVSPDGVDMYRAGYGFEKAQFIETGILTTETGNPPIHLPDAYKLGFIMGASALPGGGVKVAEKDIPVTKEVREAFEFGRKGDVNYFVELLSQGFSRDDVSSLVSTYMLGHRIQIAIDIDSGFVDAAVKSS